MPFYQIVTNAGLDAKEVEQNVNDKIWFDAKEKRYVNLRRSGIIDPASVEINAIKNSISVASSVLTMSCAIINLEEKGEVPYDE